jgi:Protein of unknown function (DUF3592)
MRHYAMSDRKAMSLIRPNKRRDWQALAKITAYVALALAIVVGLLYNKHRFQSQREQEWRSAIATIESTRTHLVMQSNSQGGGAMFYEVQILAKYPSRGIIQEQWITVSGLPKLLADAQLQAYLLKKKSQCTVRWKPSDPAHVVAEIN